MGLLTPADWKAQWISWKNPDADADLAGVRWIWVAGQDAFKVVPKTTAIFRGTVNIPEKPREGALFLAVRGNCVAKVNGREVARKREWFSFDRQDVTESLVVGENTIEVTVTSGTPSPFGPSAGAKTVPAAFSALLKIRRFDGPVLRFATDGHWEGRLDSRSDWRPSQVVGHLSDKEMGHPGPIPQPAPEIRRGCRLHAQIPSGRVYVIAVGRIPWDTHSIREGAGA